MIAFLSIFRSRRICSLSLLLGLGLTLPAQPLVSFLSNGREVIADSLNVEIHQMMAEIGVPGLSLVIIENNEIVWYQTYGIKRLGASEVIGPQTVFSGASLTKTFFLPVVYQLVDQGSLDLDKPMYQYLPNERLAHDSAYKRITPRMILSHSSGMENWAWNNFPITLEIITTPGSGNFVYSGEGYNYLSQVVEQLLDQPYETYIQERVLDPLGLKNTYLKYVEMEADSTSTLLPEDYAMGHGMFGGFHDYINYETVPSSGAHFTAEDYARLLVGIFNQENLSPASIATLKQPIAVMDSQLYWGPGFQLITSEEDTIVAQGGDNSGYKNWAMYSPGQKRGFVYLSNSDRGELMLRRINELTCGFNLQSLLRSWDSFRDMYPGTATRMINLYKEEGEEELMNEIMRLGSTQSISVDALNTLCTLFSSGGKEELATRILEYGCTLYPETSSFYYRRASKLYANGAYTEARSTLKQAKALGYHSWRSDSLAQHCQQQLQDSLRRSALRWEVKGGGETLLDATQYSGSQGQLYIFPSSQYEDGNKVCYFSTGDHLDYQLQIEAAGVYDISFRVSSGWEGGENELEVRDGETPQAYLKIPNESWGDYKTLTLALPLPQGPYPLRVYLSRGDINLNWIKISPAEPQKN